MGNNLSDTPVRAAQQRDHFLASMRIHQIVRLHYSSDNCFDDEVKVLGRCWVIPVGVVRSYVQPDKHY
jgi:hypothetical protein